MISKESAPVAWAMLMYELADAQEHLTALMSAMNDQADYDEAQLRIDLGHVYAHLNRAWHQRNTNDDLNDEQQHSTNRFPTDLDPIC